MKRFLMISSIAMGAFFLNATAHAQNGTKNKKETQEAQVQIDENAKKREELTIKDEDFAKKEQKITQQESTILNKLARIQDDLNNKVIKESEYNAQKIELDKMLENVRAKKEEIQLERQQIKEEIKALP